MDGPQSRRNFIHVLPIAAAALAGSHAFLAQGKEREKAEDEEVSTNEDLMREHGILKRVLLAYEEIISPDSHQAGFSSASG